MPISFQSYKLTLAIGQGYPPIYNAFVDATEATAVEVETARQGAASLAANLSANYATRSWTLQQLSGGVLTGTSTTALAVETGSKTLQVEAGRAWTVGTRLRVTATAAPANFLVGTVSAYSGTSLTLDVAAVGGSGSFNSWSLGPDGGVSQITDLGPGAIADGQLVKRVGAGLAGVWPDHWQVKSGPYTAVAGEQIAVDTSAGPVTITLPANPTEGRSRISLLDAAGTFASRPLTLARNGQKIMGLNEDLVVDLDRIAIDLVYLNASLGWRVL